MMVGSSAQIEGELNTNRDNGDFGCIACARDTWVYVSRREQVNWSASVRRHAHSVALNVGHDHGYQACYFP